MTMFSACIFGSEARRSRDNLSDRDMLVCCEHAGDMEKISQRYSNDGWTVQRIHYVDLKRMADLGSLFLQHLKLEGIILRDDGDILSKILIEADHAHVDMRRIRQDMLFLQQLKPPKSFWEHACLIDVNFVFFRNAAVNIGFNLGNPKFDYGQALENVREFACLTSQEMASLQCLRLGKTCYRARNFHEVDVDLQMLKRVAHKIGCVASPGDISPLRLNAYQQLRLIELNLLSCRSVYELDALKPIEKDFSIWRVIRDPKPYPKIEAACRLWISFR